MMRFQSPQVENFIYFVERDSRKIFSKENDDLFLLQISSSNIYGQIFVVHSRDGSRISGKGVHM